MQHEQETILNAGWYPDPLSPKALTRRWDGQNWTSDVRENTIQTPVAPAPPDDPAATVALPTPTSTADVGPTMGATAVRACPDCAGQVSRSAPACVHCGRPMTPELGVPATPPPPPPAGYTYDPAAPPPPNTGAVAPPVGYSNTAGAPGANTSGTAGNPQSTRRAMSTVGWLALGLAIVGLYLSYVAFGGAGLTSAVIAALVVIAGFVVAGRAKRKAKRSGQRRPGSALAATLVGLGSLVLLGFAFTNLVVLAIESGASAVLG